MTDDRRERGLALFRQIYDGTIPEPPPAGHEGDIYVENMLGQLFAEVWARDVLSIRDRRLLILGALMATGEDKMFEIHARSAYRLGEFDTEQMRELIIFMVHYIGYPKAGKFWLAIEALIAE
jgi:4-carboxymuconolactone decarboxylase